MPSTGPDPHGPNPSDGPHARQAGPNSDPPDPAAALAAAMRDVWGVGAAMLQAAAGTAQGRPETDAFRSMAAPAAGMLDAYARMMARMAGTAGPGGGPGADSGAPEGEADTLAGALADAGSVAMGSTLRYGQNLAEVFARHQEALVRLSSARLTGQVPADGDPDPADPAAADRNRAEAEALRAFLRDVSETALLEARRLEQELARVGEGVARSAAPAAGDRYTRRWSAKP